MPFESHGTHGLGVYKKGYRRKGRVIELEPKSEMEVNFKLQRSPRSPQTVRLTGEVDLVVVEEGTRSESRWFEIRSDEKESTILFDEIGMSTAKVFEQWLGETVTAIGYLEEGFIGWDHQPMKGVYVEKIE